MQQQSKISIFQPNIFWVGNLFKMQQSDLQSKISISEQKFFRFGNLPKMQQSDSHAEY